MSLNAAADGDALGKLGVKDLRARCSAGNLTKGGKKADLVARLLAPEEHRHLVNGVWCANVLCHLCLN